MKMQTMTELHIGGGGFLKRNFSRKRFLSKYFTWLFNERSAFFMSFFNKNAFRIRNRANGFTLAEVSSTLSHGNYKFAFTLAEVLITLGIIGIVAAMTLPTLIQKQNDAAIIASLKKNYSILSQALVKSQLKLGFFETWDIDTSGSNPEEGGTPANMKNVYNAIKPELKVLKECEDKAGCWHKGVTKDLRGSNSGRDSIGIGSGIFIFKLADGTNISIDDFAPATLNQIGSNYNKSTYAFWVDANGDKRPNTIGRDIFLFILTDRGLVPAGIDHYTKCDTKSTALYSGAACTAKVLSEGKIDY